MRLLRAFLRWLRARPEPPADDWPAPEGQTDQPGGAGPPPDVAPAPRADQAPAIQRSREPFRIQVGVDFGTSATKIAYRALETAAPVRPLLFQHGLEGYPSYCLPSVMAVTAQGNLVAGVEATRELLGRPWDEGLRRIKVVVAGKCDERFRDPLTEERFHTYLRKAGAEVATAEQLAAVFLAHTLRTAQVAIRGQPEYAELNLDLAYNVCVPIDHLEHSEGALCFEWVLREAEALAKEWPEGEDVSWAVAQVPAPPASWRGREDTKAADDPERRVFPVPEAVAQAASYVASPAARPGVHALVDIGAGTTDVAVFNLARGLDGVETFWYAAGNLPRGTFAVEQALAREVQGSGQLSWPEMVELLEMLGRPKAEGRLTGCVREQLEQIHALSRCIWADAFRHRKKETEWKNVQVFLSGGGSGLPGAVEVFRIPWWKHLRAQGVQYRVEALREPDDYDNVGGRAPFSRMGVAYGLTVPRPLLGEFVLPKDCPDQTPPPLPPRRPASSWDGGHLVPGRGWA